jgi:hypothetical protein
MAIKWIKHPNGVEVAVAAKDAEAHRDRILGEQLKAKVKNPTVTILDKPTPGAKSDQVASTPQIEKTNSNRAGK